MKKLIVSCLLTVVVAAAAHAQYGTERTGYEGDYFSLQGALDLFKDSYSLLDFERKLNTEENWVNNLDLNYDGRIDYIRVEHRRQGNFHAVVLQAVLDRYEVQDVAVIEIELVGPRDAILQIVGDEDLYGQEVVVEPVEGYADSRRGYHSDYGDYVNVYYWRPVQYILGPQYTTVYVSPYRWQYYPVWWRPWVPCTWNVFRPRIVVYVNYYRVVPRLRVVHVHNFYQPYRVYSYNVVQRTNTVRVEHGRPPIYRAAPDRQPDGRAGDYSGGRNEGERPVVAPRPNTSRESPSATRERTPYSVEPRASERTAPRSTTQPRTERNASPGVRTPSNEQMTRPSTTPRSSTQPRSPEPGYRSAPSPQSRTERSAPPSVRTPSREQMTRPSATPRSSTQPRGSSNDSRPAPSVQPRTERNTPSGVRTPSRDQSTRQSVAPRSTAPAPRSPAGSRATPASPQKATRGTPSKERSSRNN